MAFRSYRKESRTEWGIDADGTALSLEQINTGALLRIADAMEISVRDREALERRLKSQAVTITDIQRELKAEKRRNAALRGIIRKLKAAKV